MINVKTIQYNSAMEELDTIELRTEGAFYKRNGAYYVVYEESELSGLDGTTTKIKIKDGIVEIKRIGTHASTIVFEKGKRFQSSILTPVGNMYMEVMTSVVETDIEEEPVSINIDCEYLISIKGIFDGKNVIKVDAFEI